MNRDLLLKDTCVTTYCVSKSIISESKNWHLLKNGVATIAGLLYGRKSMIAV